MAPTAVHFGAGNIGRGFVACFLNQSGYEVIFVDVVDKAVDDLNANSSYKVIEVGKEGTEEKVITNYKAINSKHNEPEVIKAIAAADVITCSVGPNILKFIAPVIAKGLAARTESTPAAVIACENAIGATSNLEGFIKQAPEVSGLSAEEHSKKAVYGNSAIDRIVPAQDPNSGLDVKLEKFFEWVVEQKPFASRGVPKINGIHWVDDLEPFIERKLFTVNTGHATAAYWGYAKKKTTVDEALEDPEIMTQVKKALEETTSLIVAKHGISLEEQKAYADKIITRISNPELKDGVERVGRAPLRKLSRKERFIGPAFELAERGLDYSALLAAAEQAYRFQNVSGDDESAELAKIIAENTPEDIVTKVNGVSPNDKIYPSLVELVKKVKA
jgi:mannitol-1-phosphate 5-dehydrogenase